MKSRWKAEMQIIIKENNSCNQLLQTNNTKYWEKNIGILIDFNETLGNQVNTVSSILIALHEATI